jgi:hypothetical protein
MQKGKIVAIITGAISIFLAVAYLILVQLLDFRGEMVPAPTSQLPVLRVQNSELGVRNSELFLDSYYSFLTPISRR